MGANDIHNFVIKNVKSLGQNGLCCVKKHPFHTCILLFLCVLFLPFPLVFIVFAWCIPFVGFAFLVHRVLIGINCRKVKNVGLKRKRWTEVQSRRSIRSINRVRFHVPKQDNESSFMQDLHPRVAIQSPKTTSKRTFHNMSAKNNLADKKEKNVDYYACDEGGRTCTVDHGKDRKQESTDFGEDKEKDRKQESTDFGEDKEKDRKQESTDFGEDKEKRHDHGNKTVRWMNDEEKNLMDLGISEVERTKRLESLMERRRSKRVSNFQIIRNAMAMGINIPKKNPFLADSPRNAAPGSAPTLLVQSNPFDLPYDPHEEKPILSGDNFDEEFVGAHKKEPTLCIRESTSDIHETSYDRDFAIEQFLRLGSSIVANKKDDNKQPQQESSIPNEITDNNNHAKVEGESSKKAVDVVDILNETVGIEPAEKAVEVVDILDEAHSKELEVHDNVLSDQSSSSYCSSDDEPILRPNKEAILHCLSMSRMRVASMGTNLRRNAESFDCGPSALFDKSKTDGFFFGANKRIHYGSTNSVASDMLVEVSELGSSSFDEDGIGSLVNSNNPSELDLNARLRDIDEVSENDSIDENLHESTLKQEKIDEQDARYCIDDDRRMTHDNKDNYTKLEPESSTDQGSASNLA